MSKIFQFLAPFFLYTLLFLFFTQFLQAKEESIIGYSIVKEEFNIHGITQSWALINELNIPHDRVFKSYKELYDYAKDRVQQVINLRVFTTVDFQIIPLTLKEGIQQYTLFLEVEDAWTFFPIIAPSYDTNEDLSIELKINYANFFGTLINFSIDGNFGLITDKETDKLALGFWNIQTTFDNINFKSDIYKFYWIQSYNYSIKESASQGITEYYTYNESNFYFQREFEYDNDYYYKISPAFEFTYNYQDKTGRGNDYIVTEPYSVGVYQNYGQDKLNWYGNYRNGYSWDTELQTRVVGGNESGLRALIQGNFIWMKKNSDRWGYNNRVLFQTSFTQDETSLGKYIRGVPDDNIYGNIAFFSNNSLDFTALKVKGVFEIQLQPFLDSSLSFRKGEPFDWRQDFHLASGFEGILFIDKLTSVTLRGTFGYDLLADPDTNRLELLFSTSLSY